MQLISSSPPLPNCCNPSPTPKPTRLHIRHCNPTKKLQIPQSLLANRTQAPHFRDLCAPTLAQTHFTHRPKPPDRPDPHSHSHSHRSGAGERRDPESRSPDGDEKSGESTGPCANMWWSDMRAALGQRFNSGAIVCAVRVVARDRHLALPHVAVPDIRRIDWAELRRRGFEGVVFDKDNTITAPYSLRLWGPLAPSLERCKAVFGANIAVFSNSAGLCEYDHDGSKARALEGAIGIKVIRHRVKKPAGTAEEIEKHFGCESSQLIMVGDRPLTDIVYGNMNGFLTILTEPLSLAEEPFIVRQVRKFESSLVKYWSRRGLKPTSHRLLPEAKLCVIDPPIV